MKDFILMNTKQNDKFKFIPRDSQTTVDQIEIAFKASAFCNRFTNPVDGLSFFVTDIKSVRNENAHKCSILTSPERDLPKFYAAFKKYSLDTIVVKLSQLATEVRRELLASTN